MANRKIYQELKNVLGTEVKLDENEAKYNNEILKSVIGTLIAQMRKEDQLFDILFERIHYTGSYYEGLRVKSADEFDLNVVLKFPFKPNDREIITGVYDLPLSFCYYRIVRSVKDILGSSVKWGIYKPMEKFFDADGYLKPEEIRRWMQSLIDRVLPTVSIPGVQRIRPSQHGPAKTLYIQLSNNHLDFYSYQIDVDLVPVIEMKYPDWPESVDTMWCNNYPRHKLIWFLVPKPYKGSQCPPMEDVLWRLHFPEIEKSLLHDKGCVKPLIKLLKLLRDRQMWNKLASYYLKTVVMWEVIKTPSASYWNEKNMADLFIVLLKKLQSYMEDGALPYLFCPEYSLIEGIPSEEKTKIYYRIKRILNNIDNDPGRTSEFFSTRESPVNPILSLQNENANKQPDDNDWTCCIL